MNNDETQSTDPKLPVVAPTEPQEQEVTQPLVDHPETDIASFAGKVQGLIVHADAQSQVESEFKSRWDWWRNWLSNFHHEVRSHV